MEPKSHIGWIIWPLFSTVLLFCFKFYWIYILYFYFDHVFLGCCFIIFFNLISIFYIFIFDLYALHFFGLFYLCDSKFIYFILFFYILVKILWLFFVFLYPNWTLKAQKNSAPGSPGLSMALDLCHNDGNHSRIVKEITYSPFLNISVK